MVRTCRQNGEEYKFQLAVGKHVALDFGLTISYHPETLINVVFFY